MCGLVSVINKRRYGFSCEQRDVFTTLLYVDTLRGEDSTGAFVIDNIGNVKLAKDTSIGPIFTRTDEYKALTQHAFKEGWAMVGHNRKATRGTITDTNAHPFVVDDKIVLVHNGSFYGDHKHLADTDVDSEAIAHLLNKDTSIEDAFKQVNAAYACIWYEVENKRLNFIRNRDRPLFMMETEDTYYIASEPSFLYFVGCRHNLKMIGELQPFKEHVLSSFYLEDDKGTRLETKELNCEYKREVPQSNFPVAHRGTGGSTEHTSNLRRSTGLVALVGQTQQLQFNNKLVNDFLIEEAKSCELVSYADFATAMNQFHKGQKLKVIVHDIIEADNEPRTDNFILIGKYLGNPKIHVAIQIKERDFNKASASANGNVFEIQFKCMTWSNQDFGTDKPFEEKLGIAVLQGMNPNPLDIETIQPLH